MVAAGIIESYQSLGADSCEVRLGACPIDVLSTVIAWKRRKLTNSLVLTLFLCLVAESFLVCLLFLLLTMDVGGESVGNNKNIGLVVLDNLGSECRLMRLERVVTRQ